MSARTVYFIGGAAVGIVALALLPNLIALLIIVGLVAVPVVGYFMLDPSQRQRLKRITRKQIGR